MCRKMGACRGVEIDKAAAGLYASQGPNWIRVEYEIVLSAKS